jgi:hypothetical protein
MIKTKLHILADNIDLRDRTRGADNPLVKDMLNAASYVIADDVLQLLRRDDASKSIKALVAADMVRLPYNPMVVEFEVLPTHHNFCYLTEKDGIISGRCVIMDNSNWAAMVALFEIRAEVKDGQVVVHDGVYRYKSNESEAFKATFATALNLALLMLNTKGIDKQVITVAEGMNKKRVAKGKSKIPTHSVVHVGTIYRRDGSAIKNENGHGGWKMPMHWRCGYARIQHFGKNREETKMVYIPPCIVNFVPEGDAPTAPKRNVKV